MQYRFGQIVKFTGPGSYHGRLAMVTGYWWPENGPPTVGLLFLPLEGEAAPELCCAEGDLAQGAALPQPAPPAS